MKILNYTNSYNKNTSFFGAKDITLRYVIENRKNLLPPTMIKKIETILSNASNPQPTLRQLHIDTYSPLLSCKTFEEARIMYPEFAQMQDAVIFENSRSKNITEIKKHIPLSQLSLKLLQECWAKLRNHEDIAHDLGLSDRQKMGWIISKLGFVNRNKNYTTLLKASDPVLNAQIGSKTAAYNAANPEKMLAKNKHAAQFCKRTQYRKAQSKRIKAYDKLHPERRDKISAFYKEVWSRLPEVREAMIDYSQNDAPAYLRGIIQKQLQGQKLTTEELRMRKIFFSGFWTKYPQYKTLYREVCNQVSAELKAKHNSI